MGKDGGVGDSKNGGGPGRKDELEILARMTMSVLSGVGDGLLHDDIIDGGEPGAREGGLQLTA